MNPIAALHRVRVAHKNVEAQDIFSFAFVNMDGSPLPPFSAGSHVDVHAKSGPVRQYFLCNDPVETHRYLIAVLRDPSSRGGSISMHAMSVGDVIEISEPKNHFPLRHDARRSVLIAGGIGITPILAMAKHLSNIAACFELHYCSRTPDRTAFAERIRTGCFANRSHVHFDDGPETQFLDVRALMSGPDPQTHLYVCGPTGFMGWVLEAARGAGWSENCVHREYFAAASIDTSGDGSFEVQIASTGTLVRVGAHESVVAALASAGVVVPTLCEQGVCGTCLTRVLKGVPDHRDMYLTAEEHAKGYQFTPCCSRAKTARLVLDL